MDVSPQGLVKIREIQVQTFAIARTSDRHLSSATGMPVEFKSDMIVISSKLPDFTRSYGKRPSAYWIGLLPYPYIYIYVYIYILVAHSPVNTMNTTSFTKMYRKVYFDSVVIRFMCISNTYLLDLLSFYIRTGDPKPCLQPFRLGIDGSIFSPYSRRRRL